MNHWLYVQIDSGILKVVDSDDDDMKGLNGRLNQQ